MAGAFLSFASLLGGMSNEAQQIRQERLAQENANFTNTTSLLGKLADDPTVDPTIRNQAQQGAMDALMEHLGYNQKSKQTNPVRKAVEGMVGQMPNNYASQVSGVGAPTQPNQGVGRGNAQSSLGGLPPSSAGSPQGPPGPSTMLNGMAAGQNAPPTPPAMGGGDPTQMAQSAPPQPPNFFNSPSQTGHNQGALESSKRLALERGWQDFVSASPEMQKMRDNGDPMYEYMHRGAVDLGVGIPPVSYVKPTKGNTISVAEAKQSYPTLQIPAGLDDNGFVTVKEDVRGNAVSLEPAQNPRPITVANSYDPNSPTGVSTQLLNPSNLSQVGSISTMPGYANQARTTSGVHTSPAFDSNGQFLGYYQEPYTSTTTPVMPGQTPSAQGATPTAPVQGGPPAPPSTLGPKAGAKPSLKGGAPAGAVNQKIVSSPISDQQYTEDNQKANQTDGTLQLLVGGPGGKGAYQLSDLYKKIESAVKVAAAKDPSTPVSVAISRYGDLSPEENELAGTLATLKEDLPGSLRAVFGAPVARGAQMMKVMQEQMGNDYGNVNVTKTILANTFRTLSRNRQGLEAGMLLHDKKPYDRKAGISISDPSDNSLMNIARGYMQLAGGDKVKTRAMAKADGWNIP